MNDGVRIHVLPAKGRTFNSKLQIVVFILLFLCFSPVSSADENLPIDDSPVNADVPALPDISGEPELPDFDESILADEDPELPEDLKNNSKSNFQGSEPGTINTKAEFINKQQQEIEALIKKGIKYYNEKDFKNSFITLKEAKTKCAAYSICTKKLNNWYKKAKNSRKKELIKIKKYFKTALKYYKSRKYHKAITVWEKILKIDPGNKKAKGNIKGTQSEIKNAVESLLSSAGKLSGKGEIAGAVQKYNAVLKLEEGNRTAKKGLAALKSKRESCAKALHLKALDAYTKKDYYKARDYWKKALILKPGDEQIESNIKRCSKIIKGIENIKK